MKDGQEVRRIPIAIIAGVCGAVLAASGGIAWWTATQQPSANTTQSIAPPSPSAVPPNPTEQPVVTIPVPPPIQTPTQPAQLQKAPTSTHPSQNPQQQAEKPNPPRPKPLLPEAEQKVPIYWLKETGQTLEVVPATVKLKGSDLPDTLLIAAFNNLLAGPTETTLSSEIPKDTKLRSLTVKGDSVYVDLSPDFKTGGGSESMIGRLGQVLYTATSLQPDAKVWISIEGKPLEVLGGEGLEVAQPLTRQTFEKDFAIK